MDELIYIAEIELIRLIEGLKFRGNGRRQFIDFWASELRKSVAFTDTEFV